MPCVEWGSADLNSVVCYTYCSFAGEIFQLKEQENKIGNYF